MSPVSRFVRRYVLLQRCLVLVLMLSPAAVRGLDAGEGDIDSLLGGSEGARAPAGGVDVGVGVVDVLDLATGTIVIEGYRYQAAADVPVESNGVSASLASLLPGVQVQFRFLRVPGALRQLLEVRVVSANQRIHRH